MAARTPDGFLRAFVRAATADGDPASWLLALAAVLAAPGLDLAARPLGRLGDPARAASHAVGPLPADADLALLGQAHEALLDAGHRRARGVFYTPVEVAEALVALALPATPGADGPPAVPPRVLDPAVGGGAFVLAAARLLEARGWSRAVIARDAMWGIDIDPLAVAVTDAMLAAWVAEVDPGGVPDATHLLAGDTLGDVDPVPADAPRFDAVVGNPPFQNQLGATTSRSVEQGEAARARFGAAAYRYTDSATLFALAALRSVRPGGRVALILPQSFLVADDARAARDALLDDARLEQLWVATEPVFRANVRVCAPVLVRDVPPPAATEPTTVVRWTGRSVTAATPVSAGRAELRQLPTWARLTADLFGVPALELPEDGPTLASFCAATAGFRDQYYGLRSVVREATADEVAALRAPSSPDDAAPTGDAPWAALVTSGLIEPADCRWGTRPTRFAKQPWDAPLVDRQALAALDPALAAWAAARLVPKLVVATQTRVIEAVVDQRGDWFPSVPCLAVTCAPDQLWRAAAVVLAPAVSVWAFHRHAGAALSSQALKVSARQLLLAPLPVDDAAWARAATSVRAASSASAAGDAAGWADALAQFATDAGQAYGLGAGPAQAIRSWWLDRALRSASARAR